jgi:hypothetical protein
MRYFQLAAAAVAMSVAPLYPANASDANGYTAKYECRAGNPNCSIDIAALTSASCDVTVTTSDSTWSKITSNSSSRVFCIAAGDHSNKGTLSLGFSGTAQSRKVLKMSGADNAPWRLAESNRATIARLRLDGGDYWIIHRIAVDGFNRRGGGDGVFIGQGSNNNVFSQILVQRHHGYQLIGDWNGINYYNTIQNSVIRNAVLDRTFEAECVDVQKSYYMFFINNEVYNCHKAFSVGSGVNDVRGLIVENNDFYIGTDYYTDCNGKFNSVGPCSGSEAVMSVKTAGIQASPALYIQNRIWGGRSGDATLIGSDNAGYGTAISISGNMPGNSSANYMLFMNNIVMDSQGGITGWWGPDQYLSIIGNVVYNIRKFKSDVMSNAFEINSKQYSEFYLNTIINTDRWLIMGGTSNSGGASAHNDIKCNVVINGGSHYVELGSGNQIDYNAFYATTPYSTSGAQKVLSYGSASSANAGEYCFYRKLLTGAERVCIPHAKPTSSSPHFNACDANLGTRKGVGIDDKPLF